MTTLPLKARARAILVASKLRGNEWGHINLGDQGIAGTVRQNCLALSLLALSAVANRGLPTLTLHSREYLIVGKVPGGRFPLYCDPSLSCQCMLLSLDSSIGHIPVSNKFLRLN